jgi:hypothetical protein
VFATFFRIGHCLGLIIRSLVPSQSRHMRRGSGTHATAKGVAPDDAEPAALKSYSRPVPPDAWSRERRSVDYTHQDSHMELDRVEQENVPGVTVEADSSLDVAKRRAAGQAERATGSQTGVVGRSSASGIA